MDKKKLGVISLGCDKNRVDTEKMLFILSEKYELTANPEDAEIIVINTCAFLESSRREAIEEILCTAALKEKNLQKLIVTGCLPQKFVNEIFDDLPEVDAFLGVSDYDRIVDAIELTYQGKRVNFVGTPKGEPTASRIVTTNGYAYLKIADGCSNRCTYCLIPSIRGAYRSVCPDELEREVKNLGVVEELILVAQDITKYGSDNLGYGNLVSLIRRLTKLDCVKSVRLLYCYPENITEELIAEIQNNPKVLKYLDMPLQHADDGVLKKMNRKGTFNGYLQLIEKLKKQISGVHIRSTFITGFPGEDEAAFENLKSFLKKAKLGSVGFFAYSREEGTPAYKMKGQIDESVKQIRLKELYETQKEIVKELNANEIGKTYEIFVDGFDGMTYYGRSYKNAPDVDGIIYFTGKEHTCGDKATVKITGYEEYDLYGEEI